MANQILAGAVVQAGMVIAGVDASNPPYVGPPVAQWVTRSVSGNPRTLYVRSATDLDSDPTSIVNTSTAFGGYTDSAVDSNGRYYAVRGDNTENGVVFVYDTQDLSASPIELTPDSGESPYNQYYSFGYSLAMSDDKLFVGNNAQDVPVYCYDLSDLSAAPNKISTPTTYHQGSFKFSFDMTTNSTHLFIGHPQSREPISSSDNNTEAGAVHVYDLETLQYQTSLFGFDGEYGDHFGSEVKATDTHLAVGAYGDDEVNGTQDNDGAVYVFDATDLSATPTKVMSLTSGHNDAFGQAISLSDTHLAVAETNDDTNNPNSGALHIYDLNNLSNPTIGYGTLHSEYYGSNPVLFNDGSNRVAFRRRFQNTGGPTKYFVYHINDLDTPLWESETEQVYAFLPAYVAPPPPPPSTVNWVVVGAQADDDNGSSSGSVYVYDANDLSAQPTKLTAFDGAASDEFGYSVAASADKIVAAAYGDDDNGSSSGSVYVYDANDLSAQPTKLTAFDGAEDDSFGHSVDATSDKIVVGAFGDDDKGSMSGSVYVYDANDLSTQPTKLTAFDGAADDYFGYSVAVSDDKIIVGARMDDDKGSSSGSVYVYDANDLSAQPTKLTAFDGAANDRFGHSVAATTDKIVVGSFLNDDNGDNSGSVYVYDANDLSAQPTKLTAFDAVAEDRFGQSVSVASDQVVVGAYGDDDKGSSSGSVYVYDANDLSAQPTKLTAFDGAQDDYFSYSSVTANDDKIVVGAWFDDDNGSSSGSVYVYDANDLSAQPTKLTAFDGSTTDYFGKAVALG